jgi:7-cyano-7-deazaguanine tRNA-ribosyltransferase
LPNAQKLSTKPNFQSTFQVDSFSSNGRLGTFLFENHSIKTPFLFPVAYLITGTTARGGATWKYILQDQEEKTLQYTLLRRNSPVLSQVLHFLDYKLSANGLQTWRAKTIRGLYNEQLKNLNYQAPIFLDSGGFTLMWRTGLDLSKYGISLEPDEEAKSILALQKDLGGDIVATLDYPLPPNLKESEISQRMARSMENAVQAAKLLRNDGEFKEYHPFLYMAAHGLTPEAMSDYVQELFQRLEQESLTDTNFGIAIGSLVPLRKDLRKVAQVINIVRSAVSAIPEEYKDKTPVHIFGATGLQMPFLVYAGVDTFDSSTFAQEARSLQYILPGSFQRRNIMEMSPQDILTCRCPICQNMNLPELQSSLVSEIVGKLQASGHYKSKYYADIALHNLELDLQVLKETRVAVANDSLDEHIIQIAKEIPRMQNTLTALTSNDKELERKATRSIYTLPVTIPTNIIREEAPRYVSLSHTPDDFNVNNNGYKPTGKKPILLIIPCSREKPYSDSHTHKYLNEKMEEEIPGWQKKVDKITLSGLYGPVPLKYENEKAVLEYDFRLTSNNKVQIEECANRLSEFLERHGRYYEQCIAYGTSNAYRTVFDKTAKHYTALKIFPKEPKSRRLNEFFRKRNISELVLYIKNSIETVSTNHEVSGLL